MNCGYDYNTRIFSPERSQSMTILSPHKGQPRMTHLESLEAKMANIEVSLSSTNTPRRRKGTSLGGVTTTPSLIVDTTNINSNSKQEHHSAFQERDSIIQSLRVQLGLGKLPRPGLPLDESEVSKAEQELQKLRNNADKKRTVIRNLKTVLEDLDIQDNNIDVRIRQAEIEYALGREELQLLSLVEEIRALQFRLDKTVKSDTENLQTSLYFQLKNGLNM
ncbi:uncharacterized protein LOC129572746 isoform X2 [Sitodiplosis mosellana]|nr:uncharacterized protein LOC129572746 isoform X2 [Sitodiplosis mosellana]